MLDDLRDEATKLVQATSDIGLLDLVCKILKSKEE